MIRKENEELRRQLAELQAEVESKVWEGEEPTEGEEGLHLPNMDAFNELMAVCQQVTTLHKNLESLTFQAGDLGVDTHNPEEA